MNNNLIKKIIYEVNIFWKAPKEYIWIYTYPKDKKVDIEEYNPEIKEQAQGFVNKITKMLPNLKIHFLGSVALEVPGQKDIDIIIECLPHNFDNVVPILTGIIGEAKKERNNFVEWVFQKDEITYELLLIDPRSKRFKVNINTYEKLKRNKKKYAEMKIKCMGKSMREYQRKKFEFFNSILD